jgi:hypothetical protein
MNMCIFIKRVAQKSARARFYDLVCNLYRREIERTTIFPTLAQIETMCYQTYNIQRNGPRLFIQVHWEVGLITKEMLIRETFRNTAADLIAKLRVPGVFWPRLDFATFCSVMQDECTGFTQDDLNCLFRQPPVPSLVSVVRVTVTADSSSTNGAAAHSNKNVTDRYHSVDYDDDNVSEVSNVSNVSEGSRWYHSNKNVTDRYHSVHHDDDKVSEVSNVSEGSRKYPK